MVTYKHPENPPGSTSCSTKKDDFDVYVDHSKPLLRTSGEHGSISVDVTAWMPDRGHTRIMIESPYHVGIIQFDVDISRRHIYKAGGGQLEPRDQRFVDKNKSALLELASIDYGDNPKTSLKY